MLVFNIESGPDSKFYSWLNKDKTKSGQNEKWIDLYTHDDVTRPKGSMIVVVMLKSKMAPGSTSSRGNSKSTGSMIYLKVQTKSPKPLIDGSVTSEHMSALLPFKFPASGKYDATFNS